MRKYSAILLDKKPKTIRSVVFYGYLNAVQQTDNKCSQHDAISEGDTGQLQERPNECVVFVAI